MDRVCRFTILAITAFGVGAVDPASGQEGPKPAEPAVKALNNAVLSALPFANRDDFHDASRGFIATLPDALVTGSKGNVVWSQKDCAFLEKEAPDTVNPSLWRQAQLNHQHGLFKVVDGLYQIRGFDISNMTVMEGDTGLEQMKQDLRVLRIVLVPRVMHGFGRTRHSQGRDQLQVKALGLQKVRKLPMVVADGLEDDANWALQTLTPTTTTNRFYMGFRYLTPMSVRCVRNARLIAGSDTDLKMLPIHDSAVA